MNNSHIIVLPGGGYVRHADHEGEPVAEWLRSLGHSASVFAYPLQKPHPAPLDAVHAEVRRVREEGADRVALLGFSAGGHVAGHAALTATGPEQVDAAILGYPVVSMQLDTHFGSQEQLLGTDPDAALRAATSLNVLVTPQAPPFFLWHTSADDAVPVQHSYLLAQSLANHNVPHALHVFPDGEHGLGLAPGSGLAREWTSLCAEWLASLDW